MDVMATYLAVECGIYLYISMVQPNNSLRAKTTVMQGCQSSAKWGLENKELEDFYNCRVTLPTHIYVQTLCKSGFCKIGVL